MEFKIRFPNGDYVDFEADVEFGALRPTTEGSELPGTLKVAEVLERGNVHDQLPSRHFVFLVSAK